MADTAITNISLCSGVGMLDLGLRIATGARTVLHVEWEAYAAAILLVRMEQEALEPAPVWCGNLEDFDGKPWHGAVDSITTGFPCPPFSCAGKRGGTADERWIWPDIARIIGEVEPTIVFVENVPGLLVHGGVEPVLGSLADMGFNSQWGTLRAADVGAAHIRERVFILAYSIRSGSGEQRARWQRVLDASARVADASIGQLLEPWRGTHRGDGIRPAGADMAIAKERGCGELRESSEERGRLADRSSKDVADANGSGTSRLGELSGGHEVEQGKLWTGTGQCGLPVADAMRERGQQKSGSASGDEGQNERRPTQHGDEPECDVEDVADPNRRQCEQSGRPESAERDGGWRISRPNRSGDAMANTEQPRSQGNGLGVEARRGEPVACSTDWGVFAPGPDDPRWASILAECPWLAPAVKPGFRLLAHGFPDTVVDESRADQLRASGNAVVALQAACAFSILARRLK